MSKVNTRFLHYYAAVSSYKRPAGMDLHPRMIAYRFCASHSASVQFKSLYLRLVTNAYIEALCDATRFSHCNEDLLACVKDPMFIDTLQDVANKVWDHRHGI